MKSGASQNEIDRVIEVIETLGLRGHAMPGENRTAIGITGNKSAIDPAHFENLPGVADAIRVTKPYKLISKDLRPERSIVKVGNSTIGGADLAIVAGPCAVENPKQVLAVAESVAASGAKFFRGGAFKPRTSPYAFQGMGEDGLKILSDVRDQFGLNIVTEAMDEHGVDLVVKYGDCIQIGARNMQNFSLLKYAGQTRKPVLLKRGTVGHARRVPPRGGVHHVRREITTSSFASAGSGRSPTMLATRWICRSSQPFIE
jgi:3-deoxy-7-phosphoheptulonate synthase